ncbi:MAG: hypothetical protein IPJ02_08470 [Chitinophagaceae bacterium]|nr:hypothetical protein [Chitinophagaceae bacterium]
MKIRLLILSLVLANFLSAQNSLKFDSAINFIKEREIKINTVIPPPGFKVYYNCDSLLFMKGIFGDTIKIWTSAMDWYQDLEAFKDVINNSNFGITQFIKSIDDDGRIYVSTYHQTEFLYRNDSLFEIGNSNPAPSEPVVKLFSDYFNQRIDKATYEARMDSLNQIEESQAIYTPKLIFTKKMFQKSKKVRLSKKINFQGDTIELENQWIENGKACYLIRINNKEDGQKTSYAYAINQDMKFVFWEGCKGH